MIELDVPAMIHVSGCCNPAQHTRDRILNADTMAVMQPSSPTCLGFPGSSSSFRMAAARCRSTGAHGIALDNKRPELVEIMGQNIFFGLRLPPARIDLLTKVVPVDNILFARRWSAR
jgi:4-oxalmesaconate hydratase